jgi:uncharacterized protein DUF6767
MTSLPATPLRTRPEAQCPLRPSEKCNLCQLDVTGPQDCGLVYLVMSDPDLRVEWGERRRNRH